MVACGRRYLLLQVSLPLFFFLIEPTLSSSFLTFLNLSLSIIYRNQYRRVTQENSNSLMQDTHATLTFTVTFPHDNDTCWIAYHYPYTYSSLQSYLNQQELLGTNAHKLRRQLLCKSLHGNRLDLLTITNFNSGSFSEFPLENRRYVFLSGRVSSFHLFYFI